MKRNSPQSEAVFDKLKTVKKFNLSFEFWTLFIKFNPLVKVERFNRTMQEEWLADPDIQVLMREDQNKAQEELQKYVDWYNDERPHQSINYMTPNEYVLYFNARGDHKKSQMY